MDMTPAETMACIRRAAERELDRMRFLAVLSGGELRDVGLTRDRSRQVAVSQKPHTSASNQSDIIEAYKRYVIQFSEEYNRGRLPYVPSQQELLDRVRRWQIAEMLAERCRRGEAVTYGSH